MLDTPEGHWLVIKGYHIHKAFWGSLLTVAGLLLAIFFSGRYFLVLIIGAIVVFIDIAGHIYTNRRPYFVLIEKYKKSE